MSAPSLIEMLDTLSMPMAVAIGGTVAIVALLRLATFSWEKIFPVGAVWFLVAAVCSLFSLRSPTAFFLTVIVGGWFLYMLPAMMEPNNTNIRRWVLYVVWIYFWGTAFIGWRYGWLGLLFLTLPALLIAGLWLFFIAGFLLPFPNPDLYRGDRPAPDPKGLPTFAQEIKDFLALVRYPENRDALKNVFEQRRKALRCLLTFALGTNYPYYVVIDEKITGRTEETRTWLTEEEKLIERVGGNCYADFLAGPGVVLTGCDQAVVLATSLKFKGGRGPGVVLTEYGDVPKPVIDLRVQLRAFPVEAWTKDGIAVRVVVFIPFQIGRGGAKPTRGTGFRYRSSDVFKAVQAQLVEHEDPSQVPENLKQHPWYDLPAQAGERFVREIISHYEFDDLYAPFELHADAAQDHPRSRIARELGEKLDQVLPGWGIQRVGSGIGNIMPVDERVIEQRIEAWKADWARQIMIKQAEGQAERLRLIEQARAQAQVDIVVAVGERIEQLRIAGADAIARNFIEVLTELSGSSALRRLLPRGTSDVLRRASGGFRRER